MAKILALLGELSGSIADNAFSHNKGGAYVRQRTVPTNPNSTKQQAARTILGTVSGEWAGLTDGQRTQWTDWASINPVVDPLGQTVILSGQQAYCALNSRLVQSGLTSLTTPPVGTGPDQFLTLSVVAAGPDQLTVTFTATPLAAGTKMLVWMTLPSTAGRNPNFAQARLVGYSTAADVSPTTYTTPYPFSTADVFNMFFQRMAVDGRVSVAQKVRVTVP